MMRRSIKVFYSYAHDDTEWLERLRSHLKVFKQQGYMTEWDDRAIQPGTSWKEEIDWQLSTSDLILLLLSDHYLASSFCSTVEMAPAIELHERGKARTIPILLSPVSWKQPPLGALNALPSNEIPLTQWSKSEEALTSLAQEIGQIVREIAMAKENESGFPLESVEKESAHRSSPRSEPGSDVSDQHLLQPLEVESHESLKRVRIGRNVCEARIKLGWTQEQLGAPEFSSSYISALERGKISVSLKALSIIAKRLHVPQERLLEDSQEE